MSALCVQAQESNQDITHLHSCASSVAVQAMSYAHRTTCVHECILSGHPHTRMALCASR